VLRGGEVVMSGAGVELWSSEEVKAAYFGTTEHLRKELHR
jgi:hypothetical protein